MDITIRRLVRLVKKGDQKAFEELVDIYKNRVYHICYRMLGNSHEAEDMAQEAFLRAYLHIERFNEEHKFSTWLYRIATNLTIDRLRKKKPDYYLDADVAGSDGLTLYSQVAVAEQLPEEKIETFELQERIQLEILQLPPKYRSAITLKYLEELSLKEISEILQIPVSTVKTRIHRGREALRKRLTDLDC
ncbi:RNA polymerase sigma factor SigW [Alkalihalobacillus sp. AL-G]|uniref:RNA polymerase sigma factor SigW n=1 Tax=Alkalihalobacillus sp. AL-G TaxID=2926399 RepID=UPI0027296062|nr:RNA polymerase sigma factor SigW [Alkalihalobacillus sp. AL-G]WLD93572.1 RNA polymerase sigma factor SigW [Alkalihalobacillus sp. AL-G]